MSERDPGRGYLLMTWGIIFAVWSIIMFATIALTEHAELVGRILSRFSLEGIAQLLLAIGLVLFIWGWRKRRRRHA